MQDSGKKRSVLLVDDEPLISLDLCDTLTEAGYNVIGPASTMAAALSLLDRQRPQMAVIDVKFRDGLCLDLARALRLRSVPFIVHTGYPRDSGDAVEFRTSAHGWDDAMISGSIFAAGLVLFAAGVIVVSSRWWRS